MVTEDDAITQDQVEPTAASTGWWGTFVALLAGAPPFAVWADEQEDDDEHAPNARD